MDFRPRLPCALFGHKARREPVWNDGYYFTTCSRCGEDVVRIAGERWHRPRGARVVWSATAPPSRRQAALERHRTGPLQPWSELPAASRISGVATREVRHGTQTRAAVVAQRRSSIPDFMDDPGTPGAAAPGAAPAEPATGEFPARPFRVA